MRCSVTCSAAACQVRVTGCPGAISTGSAVKAVMTGGTGPGTPGGSGEAGASVAAGTSGRVAASAPSVGKSFRKSGVAVCTVGQCVGDCDATEAVLVAGRAVAVDCGRVVAVGASGGRVASGAAVTETAGVSEGTTSGSGGPGGAGRVQAAAKTARASANPHPSQGQRFMRRL
jgi:hypothetical protein